MQTARDRSLAEEWLPSRFNLAIFQMLGLLAALRLRSRRSAAVLLHHDREQHPLEAYALSGVLLAVPSVHFFAAIVSRLRWPWVTGPLVVIAMPFAAAMAWDLLVFTVAFLAFVVHKLTSVRIKAVTLQSPVIHSVMIAVSASSIAFGWRTAWLGVAWLALVLLNELCAIVLWAGRNRVTEFIREVSRES